MRTLPIILASALFLPSLPVMAEGVAGYSRQCFKEVYREEYIPGTVNNPGRVRTWTEQREVSCRGDNVTYSPRPRPEFMPEPTATRPPVRTDDNSCIEGSVLGGILGGGIGAAASRGDGRFWSIPLGVVSGAMVGCQVDGG